LLQAYSVAKKIVEFATSLKARDGERMPLSMYVRPAQDKYVQLVHEGLAQTKLKSYEHDILDTVWMTDLGSIAKKKKLLVSQVKPSDATINSTCFGNLPLREQRAIALYETDARRFGFSIDSMDTSQGIPRMTVCTDGSTPTFLPNGRVIVFPPHVDEMRMLVGREKLNMQGIPDAYMELFIREVNDLSYAEHDSLLANLAGNAFPGSIIFCFLVSILKHAKLVDGGNAQERCEEEKVEPDACKPNDIDPLGSCKADDSDDVAGNLL
jgi:hypothetical protein